MGMAGHRLFAEPFEVLREKQFVLDSLSPAHANSQTIMRSLISRSQDVPSCAARWFASAPGAPPHPGTGKFAARRAQHTENHLPFHAMQRVRTQVP